MGRKRAMSEEVTHLHGTSVKSRAGSTHERFRVGPAGGNWNQGPPQEPHGEAWSTPGTELANGQNCEKYETITPSSHGKTKGYDGSQ